MRVKATVITVILGLLFLCSLCLASVPPMINYQGKLMQPSGVPVPDGTFSMTYAIYSVPTVGTALWSETNPSVQVKGGLFSVLLGSVNNLPGNIFDNENRWFGVTVGTDPEMTPRQKIASVAFAEKAASADIASTVPDGAITTGKLAELSVTNAKIANESVDAAKIAPNAVTTDKIADGNVSTAKIAAGAVDATRLSAGAITLGYAEAPLLGQYITSTPTEVIVGGVAVLSKTVTIPPGNRRVKITCQFALQDNTAANNFANVVIYEDESPIFEFTGIAPRVGVRCTNGFSRSIIPSAGPHTYHVKVHAPAATISIVGQPADPAFILVELI